MNLAFKHHRLSLLEGDSKIVLPEMPADTFDSIVTDPPYELAFMGKKWDGTGIAYDVDFWKECLRVLKPGGYCLAFGGTRTYHRMACAIEDAGFEIVDSIDWIYGSGFPKALDISKAIDKKLGAARESSEGSTTCPDFPDPCNGHPSANGSLGGGVMRHALPTSAASPEAKQWEGWKTQLKPAHEPIVVARKPFKGTFADNVLTHGTSAMNIDGCRVGSNGGTRSAGEPIKDDGCYGTGGTGGAVALDAGRYPPNVVFTHTPACVETGTKIVGSSSPSVPDPVFGNGEIAMAGGTGRNGNKSVGYAPDGKETVPAFDCAPGCPVAALDAQSGTSQSPTKVTRGGRRTEAYGMGEQHDIPSYGDTGGASRFFPVFKYQAKAPTRERPKFTRDGTTVAHATVKPVGLMRWLVRLVTQPNGLVLDPFNGSGATGEACHYEGFRYIGVELEPDHIELTKVRWENCQL